MTAALIIIGLMFFTVVSALRRDWAVYLIVLLLPTYQIRFQLPLPLTDFSIPATFLEGMVVILGLFAAWDFLRRQEIRKKILSPRPELILTALFLIAGLVAVLVSPTIIKAAGIYKAYFIEAVVFSFTLRIYLNSVQKIKNFFLILTLFLSILSLFGVFQFLTLFRLPFHWWGVEIASRRIVSLVDHPNPLALILGPLVAMTALIVATGQPKGQTRLFYLFSLSVGAVALFLTFSRAGWLAVFLTGLVFAFFLKSWKKIILGIAILALLVLSVPFARAKLADLASGQDLSQENRYLLWQAAGEMLKESPVLGVGLTGFHEKFKNYPTGPDRVVHNYPHNFFLNFWLETGLLGLIAVLSLVFLFYRRLFHLYRSGEPMALPVAAMMTVTILHGLVDVPFFKNDLSIFFWLILALPLLLKVGPTGEVVAAK